MNIKIKFILKMRTLNEPRRLKEQKVTLKKIKKGKKRLKGKSNKYLSKIMILNQ